MATGCTICRRPPESLSTCCPTPEVNRLASISLESRAAIQLSAIEWSHAGVPFVDEPNGSLRDLTIQQTEYLAARSSPIAQAIQKEKAILCRSPTTPAAARKLLDLTAAYERNQSAGQAMEAYLNLVEVHLQHELLIQSKVPIDDATATVAKLRENLVSVPFDDREFFRQRLELDERSERLHHQQNQLNAQLESLLQLDKRYVAPIWTNYQSQPVAAFDRNAEIAVAFENRTDLAALRCLAYDGGSSEMLEWLRATARSTSPLLGIIAGGRGLFGSRQSEESRESEAANRRCQVENLARLRRDMIEMEVSDAVDSIATRLRVIELKRQSIASVQESLEASVEGKDLQPIDLKSDLELKLRLLTLRSELIHEIVELEKDVVRLRQSQGVLGRSEPEHEVARKQE